MKIATTPPLIRQRPSERLAHFGAGLFIGFFVGVLFAIALVAP